MNTTTNTRGVKYTPEQVERQASILSDTWGVGEAYKMLRAYAATLRQNPARGVTEAMVDECHHDWVDYVQAEYKPRHRVIELGESNIERYVRIGLMCTTCGKEKPAPAAPPAQPAERVPEGWPRVHGISRDVDNEKCLLVSFADRPSDDELRSFHDALTASPAPSEGGKGVEG